MTGTEVHKTRQLEALVLGSGMFDPDWYRKRYADVAMSGVEPLRHYVNYGLPMKRCPGPGFDPAWYCARNPDVAADGVEAFAHFIHFGRKEGRAGTPPAMEAGLAASLDAAPSPLPQPGYLDRVKNGTIEGWAIDDSMPGQSVDLSLYVDGEHVLDFPTSENRKDVSAKGMRGERSGFSIAMPPGTLRAGQLIDVRRQVDGSALKGSPKVLDAAPVRGPAPTPLYLTASRSGTFRRVTVVVPVFNSPDAVAGCLASLHAHGLPPGADVLVLDDGSDDPRVAPLLARYAREAGFRLHRNEANIGYTKTVNRALELCRGDDVVLLNSDTIVTPRWLHALRYCAYSQPDIGTVTALSDNAGAFSVPVFGAENPLPPGLGHLDAALAIVQAGEGVPIDVPTGNGFCMYLRRDAIDAVGAFDEVKYPLGYGEENDLCMRLLHAGWRNVVCDKAYVRHLRNQSFGDRKKMLVEQGARMLAADFPEYRGLTSRLRDLDFSWRRARIRAALDKAVSAPPRPRILYVISTTTGGTPQTNQDLMREMSGQYECFLLRSNAKVLTLSRMEAGALVEIESVPLHFPINPIPHRSDEYDRIVADMLHRHSIELLHIRHVAWHGLGIAAAAKALQVPVVYSMHDFYSLCPSVNLMDTGFRYRGTSIDGARHNPLWPSHPVPDGFVPRWRRMMDAFLSDCDAFVTTAPSAAALFAEVFPHHAKRMQVIPHGRDFGTMGTMTPLPVPQRPLKVLVPGNVSISKGARLLEQLEALDAEGRIELHFLGKLTPEVERIGIHHGTYQREQFGEKLQRIAPHVGVVLSIWPETFCHTLTEMWSCGLPVLGLDIGAVGDRIREVGGGWLLPPDASAGDVFERLLEIAGKPAEVAARQAEIVRWQDTTALVHDTAHMAAQYRQLYHRVRGNPAGSLLRVGLVMKARGKSDHPATAHIRLLRPLQAAARSGRIDARKISVDALLAGAVDAFDVLVVQRDAVPPRKVDALLAALDAASLPWVYEIDDLLWDLPPDHLDHDIDAASVMAMTRLARGASTITTSTPGLARALAGFNPRVRVLPNALDERLWCAPLSPALVDAVAREAHLQSPRPRILYMGSKSHATDLRMIVPAIERIVERHPEVEIVQIGGGLPLPYARELRCPSNASSYPAFVSWFRAVGQHCTLALAPLRTDRFNDAKSDIKWMDYAMARLPAVLSATGPYAGSVVDGETGILCDDSMESWTRAIDALLESGDLARSIGDAAFHAVRSRMLDRSGLAEQWLEVLEASVAGPVHAARLPLLERGARLANA